MPVRLVVRLIAGMTALVLLVELGGAAGTITDQNGPGDPAAVAIELVGGSSDRPEQQSGSADGIGPAGSTETSMSSPERPFVRPAGAVPDGVEVPEVRQPEPAGPALLTDVELQEVAPQAATEERSIRIAAGADDTYVIKGSAGNRSGEIQLQAGNRGGGAITASYLHFGGVTSQLPNQYIIGSSLVLLNAYSESCAAQPVDVFAVGRGWSGSTMTTWPGAPVAGHLATRSFSHGECPGNPGRAPVHQAFPLPADTVTDWTHGTPFHGLSVRAANEGDAAAFKRFGSANAADVDARPYLDVRYAPQGAAYRVDEVTVPTAGHTGQMKVTVTNRGSATWAPTGSHRFGYFVQLNGRTVQTSPKFAVPRAVSPGESVQLVIPMATLDPNSYQVFVTMYDGTRDYQPTYGAPYGVFSMRVLNVPPSVNRQQPGSGAAVGSIAPTLYAEAVDTDGWPGRGLTFQFQICTNQAFTTGCKLSEWGSATWTPPAGTLEWSRTYYWRVRAHDTVAPGPWAGPLVLSTQVPQPEITAHLGGAPDGAPAPGLDPQVGNYGMAETDAAVRTVGPDLTITRTYNSLDPRTDTAFGQGWSSRLDTRLVEDGDGSGNAVVTLPSGREVRFGRNHDGSYAPPAGERLDLVFDSATGFFTLRDDSGWRWVFNPHGRLLSIIDASGLVEELEYDVAGPEGQPKSIFNTTSRRRLHLTWTGGHVTSVRTDPPGTGQAALVWTYEYEGHALVAACAPGSVPECTQYEYGAGSHYRSVVLDDNPRGYWRFGESTPAGGAANATARTPGADRATYAGVAVGGQGALAGTADSAAAFGGVDAGSRVVLPSKLTSPTMSLAVELWFRTTSGGVLFSYADQPFGTAPRLYTPVLYVGQDGRLRGGFWVPRPDGPRQIVSDTEVNDGQWHHVVLSGAIDEQKLYIDGVAQKQDDAPAVDDTVAGVIDHDEMPHLVVGAGRTVSWPSGNNGDFYFNGSIDEVAVYQHALGAPAVAQHYAAGQQVVQLQRIIRPEGDRIAAELTYDDINDRVAVLTDSDGRVWRLDTPVRNEAERTVALHGPYPDWTFKFDADHGGRLLSRQHNGETRRFEYNTEGFLTKEIDELGHEARYTTDKRGNVLSRTTCRAPDSCQTSYSTYFVNEDNPLDPRNDRKLSDSDARSTAPDDQTYRTTYAYDSAGRMISTTYPKPHGVTAAPVETWKYSTGSETAVGGGNVPAGLLIEHTGRRSGQVTRYAYRASGDLAEQVDPGGLRTQYGYDALGRVLAESTLSATGRLFGTTQYTYTPRSQVDTETGPVVTNAITGGQFRLVTNHDYDANGNLVQTTLTDSSGAQPPRVTVNEYDAHDNLVAVTHPDRSREEWSYRNAGQEISHTDGRGTVWVESFDSQGRLLSRAATGPDVDPEDPDATLLVLETRVYDAAGRLARQRDAMGRETTYTYYDDDLPATVSVAGVVRERFRYDPAGNVIEQTAPGGRVTTMTYDPAGNLATSTLDPAGLARTTTNLYTPDGLVATERRTGAAQPDRVESVNYTYDLAGGLLREDVEVRPGDVLSITYTRDERGLTTSMTDRRRLITDYTYDAYGRLVTEMQPAVTTWVNGQQQTGVRPTTRYGYSAFGDLTHEQDANGAVTTLAYDTRGRNTSVRLPAYTPPGGTPINAVVEFAYDALGNLTQMTDPLRRVTEWTYDPYGRAVTETLPAVDDSPRTTEFGYDRNGELLSVTQPSGIRRFYTYDHFGRQITETAVERKPQTTFFTTEYGYDGADNLTSITTPAGMVTQASYNQANEVETTTDPAGLVTSYAYDDVGRMVEQVDPAGVVSRASYDRLGRATDVFQLTGDPLTERRRWHQSYDPNGNLTEVVSPEGRVQAYGYDAGNRLAWQDELVDPADAASAIRSTFGYDPAGNLTRFVDGRRNATDYTFTPWGLPQSTIDPDQRTWTTRYDAAGRAVGTTAPGGVTLTSTYDAQGRLTAETGSGAEAPTAAKAFEYDPDGRLVAFGAPGGLTTLTYDDRGNLAGITGPSGNASFVYDADSRLLQRTDATGQSTFGYDDAGRLESLQDGLSGRTIDYVYDGAGRLAHSTERGMERFLRRVNAYDQLGRLVSDQVTEFDPEGGDPRVILGAEYTFDADDNLMSKTTIAENQRAENAYAYDGLSRLESWTGPDGAVTPYEWDAAGNRTRAGAETFEYDAANRLTADGDATYTYTPRGTLASVTDANGQRTMTFDAFDRLVTDGGTAYSYDSLGRVAARDGTAFAYSSLGNDVVSDGERLVSRGVAGEPVADRAVGAATTAKLLFSDTHGDIIGRYRGLDSFGRRTFDPFGAVTAATGEQSALGYQGEWTDPDTGAVNMHARWYTPDAGGFASRDSWTIPQLPSGAGNRYSYGNANPLTHVDPSGHLFWIPLVAVAARVVLPAVVRTAPVIARTAPRVARSATRHRTPRPHVEAGRGWNGSPRWRWFPDFTAIINGIGNIPFWSNGPRMGPGPGGGPGQSGGGPGGGPGGGSSWQPAPIVIPPPPPPPAWLVNIVNPPARPAPGKTAVPRPPRVRADHAGTRQLDKTGEYAAAATEVTTALAGAELGGVLAPFLRAFGQAELEEILPDDQPTELDRDAGDCLRDSGRGYRSYWDLDALGRATGADACIGPEDLTPPGTGRHAPFKASAPVAGYDPRIHQKSHLIGAWAGGVGTRSENLVPLTAQANGQEMYHNYERCIRERVQDGERVHVTAIPVYEGDSLVPTALTLHAIGSRGYLRTFTILNKSFVNYDPRRSGREYCA